MVCRVLVVTFDESSIFNTPPPGSWRFGGACAGEAIDVFFPKAGSRPTEALRVCAGCSVRVECAEYALEHNQHWGVWGGLTERQRFAVKKARRLGEIHPLDPQRSASSLTILTSDDASESDAVDQSEHEYDADDGSEITDHDE